MSERVEHWPTDVSFDSQVRRTIEPIVSVHGLMQVEAVDSAVKYASDRVWIELRHEPDGEVALYFGQVDSLERFSFLLYLRWSAPAEPAAYADGVASADNDVQQVLDTFARLLGSVGAPLLDGDPETYARMKAVRWWDSTPDVLTGP